ncbi:MAG: LPS export ABC transporter periplasmic protein LptC [Methyloligellaceae bacterium]
MQREIQHIQTLSNEQRHKAFRQAKRHSRYVRLLRIIFPVLALSVAGLYFLSSSFEINVGDLQAKIERLEVSKDELTMVNPRLEGYTNTNGKYLVLADAAIQNLKNPDLIKLNAIDAQLTEQDESWSRVLAATGSFHTKKEFMQLRGGIKVTSSSGMNADLDAADLDMKKQIIVSKSPVTVRMPSGTVDAEQMTLLGDDNEVVFEGNVKVRLLRTSSTNAQAQNTVPSAN